MPQPMQNPEDSSDPTTTMNTTLSLLAKAFKVNTISTNNNQISLLIPRNSQIAQSGMNTIEDIKMQMVDDNVGNQPRQNAYGNGDVVTAPTKGNGNGINGNLIRCYNYRGGGHYASNCIVKPRNQDATYLQQLLQIAQEEEVGIQNTQEKFEFMAAVGAYEETKRVKVNCTSKDTLQQASTSKTQYDNASIYDSDGSTESLKVYSVICSKNYSNGENQVVSKSFAVTTGDASDKRQQQQDSTSSTSTLATTITADENFDLTRPTPASLEMCMCLKDHLDAAKRIQHTSNLENCLDFEAKILEEDMLEHEAIALSDEEVTLDEDSSEARSSGGEEIYDMTLSESD
uniref:Zinc finger BED domain-containing protein RICESLEEPER 2 n=1 Tax=Tanacetum cinerariifolium TaxID=118510 RepID=A0A6L2NAF6_TANCI|nr:zinc finger BED domain-containing protein RICESLEEPER 2 [Tanacetum cinerariifolium]